jgi:Fe2+ or Zn2+ uptake regulation protein
VSKEWEPDDVFDVLASETARRVLAATSVRAMSAQELGEVCDTSLPTVYRRVNALVEYDLLSAELEVDTDGTQYKTYTNDLERIEVRVDDGSFNVNIEIEKDAVDQFGAMFSDLQAGASADEDTEE